MTPGETEVILAQLDAIREDVSEIKAQTIKTNGRVRDLELWKARSEGVRSAFSWVSPVVAGVISALVVAAVLALITAL